jgi:hypothetical protein
MPLLPPAAQLLQYISSQCPHDTALPTSITAGHEPQVSGELMPISFLFLILGLFLGVVVNSSTILPTQKSSKK